MDKDDRSARSSAQAREERVDPVPAMPPSLHEVSDEAWKNAWVAVLTYAVGVTRSLDRAEDIRQETFLRLLTTRPWTPARDAPFERHALLVASSVRKHQDKASLRRAHHEADAGAEHNRGTGFATTSPEQDILEDAEARRKRRFAQLVLEELRRKLEEFPLELQLIDRVMTQQAEEDDDADEEKPSETAQALGVSVEEVYRARARIRRYKDGVIAAARKAADAEEAKKTSAQTRQKTHEDG